MKRLFFLLWAILLLFSCGQTYEEKKRISRQQWLKLMREDSAALKIAVMPTLDCLPLFVAKDAHLFDTLGVDIRLKEFKAQMDCDTALVRGRVEGVVSDLVRTERIISQGMPLDYLAATGAYWQLITNRTARIRDLKQLDDKMLAMARYSATDMLADWAIDSAKLKIERVFKVQINDVGIRLRMLQNNEMDAVWLAEPQATEARLAKHRLVADSRRLDWKLGVLALRKKNMDDKNRQRQIKALRKAYDMACDSINKNGIRHYSHLVVKYCGMTPEKADSLPIDFEYARVAQPRQQDVELAKKWLQK